MKEKISPGPLHFAGEKEGLTESGLFEDVEKRVFWSVQLLGKSSQEYSLWKNHFFCDRPLELTDWSRKNDPQAPTVSFLGLEDVRLVERYQRVNGVMIIDLSDPCAEVIIDAASLEIIEPALVVEVST